MQTLKQHSVGVHNKLTKQVRFLTGFMTAARLLTTYHDALGICAIVLFFGLWLDQLKYVRVSEVFRIV